MSSTAASSGMARPVAGHSLPPLAIQDSMAWRSYTIPVEAILTGSRKRSSVMASKKSLGAPARRANSPGSSSRDAFGESVSSAVTSGGIGPGGADGGARAGRERGRRGRGHDALRGDRRHLAKYTRTRGARPGGWVPRRGHAGGGREGARGARASPRGVAAARARAGAGRRGSASGARVCEARREARSSHDRLGAAKKEDRPGRFFPRGDDGEIPPRDSSIDRLIRPTSRPFREKMSAPRIGSPRVALFHPPLTLALENTWVAF